MSLLVRELGRRLEQLFMAREGGLTRLGRLGRGGRFRLAGFASNHVWISIQPYENYESVEGQVESPTQIQSIEIKPGVRERRPDLHFHPRKTLK